MTAKSTLTQDGSHVLTINGGSSSIKFALYQRGDPPKRKLQGTIDRIGLSGTSLAFHDQVRDRRESQAIGERDHAAAAHFLCDWLAQRIGFDAIGAVGHRIVNGGARYYKPQPVTRALLDELRRIVAYAPEHLPAEIAMIDLFSERLPDLPQVACFDTAFHRDMPRVARILPIPRRFQADGVERYGFHGLSYAYLMEELARVAGAEAALGKVVLAHLGNGASLAAVRDGNGIDTSMGFTPAAGVPMSTRSGDLDPGLAWYFAQAEHMTALQFHQMVNHESGLLGISETSSDLRDLLDRESGDIRAAEASGAVLLPGQEVDRCLCRRPRRAGHARVFGRHRRELVRGPARESVKAWISSAFSSTQCRNAASEPVISADASRVKVRVIRTDEDMVIARAVFRILGGTDPMTSV